MRHKVGTTGVTFKKYTSKSPAPLPVPHELARPAPIQDTQTTTQTQKHTNRAPHASDTRPTGQFAQTICQTTNNNARAPHAHTTHPTGAQTHTTGPSHRAPHATHTQTQVPRARKLVHFDRQTKFTRTHETPTRAGALHGLHWRRCAAPCILTASRHAQGCTTEWDYPQHRSQPQRQTQRVRPSYARTTWDNPQTLQARRQYQKRPMVSGGTGTRTQPTNCLRISAPTSPR
jgi:hypothetical protein